MYTQIKRDKSIMGVKAKYRFTAYVRQSLQVCASAHTYGKELYYKWQHKAHHH